MSLNFNGNYIGGVPSGGGGGTPYILPVASTTTLGGVKIDGTSITIDDGVISSTGGGVSNHSQLTNLDYANSGHTGFMKDDASNLTSAGQKVFDGQWGESKHHLNTGYIDYPTSTADEYDLSSYLPDDNYNYEVMVSGVTRSITTVGKSLRIELASDIFPAILFADCACVASGQTNQCSGSIIIPVGTGRKIKAMPLSWAQGTYSLWISGYRRIGTNQ